MRAGFYFIPKYGDVRKRDYEQNCIRKQTKSCI